MSKGLKSLEYIKECPIYDPYQDSNSPDPSYTSLIKKESYLRSYFRDVEKELKALEIIKKKRCNVSDFITDNPDWEEVSTVYEYWFCELPTKEEYELLKEILL